MIEKDQKQYSYRQIEPDVIVLDVMPDQLSKEQYQIEKLGMKFRLMQI